MLRHFLQGLLARWAQATTPIASVPLTLPRRLFLASVYGAALIVLAISVATTSAGAWHGLSFSSAAAGLIFGILIVLSQMGMISLQGKTINLDDAFVTAVLLVLPMPYSLLLLLLTIAAAQTIRPSNPAFFMRILNIGVTVVGAGVSIAICSLLAPPWTLLNHSNSFAQMTPAFALLIGVYLLTIRFIVATYVATFRGQRYYQALKGMFDTSTLLQICLATTGIVVALAWRFNPWTLVCFAGPALGFLIAIRGVEAEHRADVLAEESEHLKIVLNAGAQFHLDGRTVIELMQPIAEAAHQLADASFAAVYVGKADDARTLTMAVHDGETPNDLPKFLDSCNVGPGVIWNEPDQRLTIPLVLTHDALPCGAILMTDVHAAQGQSLQALSVLATQAAITLDNARLHAEVTHQATHDPLTSLLNRRAFQDCMDSEASRFDRYGHPVALLTLDLDRFKTINDTYGHKTGDRALIAVADALRATVRDADHAARLGGDEFVVLLPETDRAEALTLGLRVCAALAELSVQSDDGRLVPVGTSVGVAGLPADGTTMEDLLNASDAGAYVAKKAGKGRVGLASNEWFAPAGSSGVLDAATASAPYAPGSGLPYTPPAQDSVA